MAPTTAVCPPDIMNKIGVPLDRIHPVAIIVSDPSWITMMGTVADKVTPLGNYKNMHSMEMEYQGQAFFVVSYGFGATGLHRVITELGVFGVRCCILVEDSKSLVPGRVAPKELCITYAACRDELSSSMEIDIGYPATAHPDATRALRESAKELSLPVRLTRTYTNDEAYPGRIQRKNEMYEEILQTGFELRDRIISMFLISCSVRRMVAGVITCNETEPTKFDPVTGSPIEEKDFVEARLNAMRIALRAAAKLVVQYDFKEGDDKQ